MGNKNNEDEEIKKKIMIVMKGCNNKYCLYTDCFNFIGNENKNLNEEEKKEKWAKYLNKCKNNDLSICNNFDVLESEISEKYPYLKSFYNLSNLLSTILDASGNIQFNIINDIIQQINSIDEESFISYFTIINYNIESEIKNLNNLIKMKFNNQRLKQILIILFNFDFIFDTNNYSLFKPLIEIYLLLNIVFEEDNNYYNLDNNDKLFFQNKIEYLQNNLMINYYNDEKNYDCQKGLLLSLNLIYKINKKNQFFNNEMFLNEVFNSDFDLKTCIMDYYKNKMKKLSNIQNYMYHTYLFNLVNKIDILHYENLIEQKLNITNSMFNINSIMNIGNLFFTISVRRETILQDALNQLNLKAKGNRLKSELKVNFIGEQGIDDGGLKKEFFYLLIEQLFDPNFGMFILKNDDRVFWFNQFSFECNLNFELIGILLGLALYNSIVWDLKIPLAIYKKLMNQSPTIKDLEEIDNQLYFTLNNIKKASKEDIEIMDLDFTLEIENYGVINKIELIPNGSTTKLTFENKNLYVEKYLNWFFNTSIFNQFNPFYNGFRAVLNSDIFNKFESEEIMKAIVGSPILDFNELKKTSKYTDGYDENHRIISEFWEILNEYSDEDKKKFLKFLTGSDRSPIKGLSSIKMVISRASPDSENLPSAHTCYNHLLIPEYTDKEKLFKKLKQSIDNSEGFGLI